MSYGRREIRIEEYFRAEQDKTALKDVDQEVTIFKYSSLFCQSMHYGNHSTPCFQNYSYFSILPYECKLFAKHQRHSLSYNVLLL